MQELKIFDYYLKIYWNNFKIWNYTSIVHVYVISILLFLFCLFLDQPIFVSLVLVSQFFLCECLPQFWTNLHLSYVTGYELFISSLLSFY